jgi:hypothetical protein
MSDPVVSQVRQMKEQDRDLWTNHETRPSFLSEFNKRQGASVRDIVKSDDYLRRQRQEGCSLCVPTNPLS